MWDVKDKGSLGYEFSGRENLGCGMLEIWDLWNAGCWGCGMLWM